MQATEVAHENNCVTSLERRLQLLRSVSMHCSQLPHSTAIVVTSCTSRKRGGAVPLKFAAGMIGADIATTAGRWRNAVRHHPVRVRAEDLYGGRSFSDARAVAHAVHAEFFIVSAGLGLIAANDQVPPYDLTVASKKSDLNTALARLGCDVGAWWKALCGGQGISELIRRRPEALVLIAMPATYIQMVADELESVGLSDIQRVRLFTSPAGRELLPPSLLPAALPYDERLECVRGYGGTRGDFPQRALRHFVEQVREPGQDLSRAALAVEKALALLKAPSMMKRPRLSDDEVKQLIRLYWDRCNGHASKLLRALRHEARVACEQARFSGLWRAVREETTSTHSSSSLRGVSRGR